MDTLLDIDRAVFLAVNQLVGRVPVIDSFVSMIADMSLAKTAVLVALFWALWFSDRQETGAGRDLLAKAAIGVFLSMVLARTLQNLLPLRVRPISAELPGTHYMPNVDPEHVRSLADWSSMPSDHAVVAFALATAIFLRKRALGWFAFFWAAFIICAPRLYLGRHYLGDILIGAALGTTIVVLVTRSRLVEPASRFALRVESRLPAVFYFAAFVVSQQLAAMFEDIRRLGGAFGRVMRIAGIG